jgi:hypothetical protein
VDLFNRSVFNTMKMDWLRNKLSKEYVQITPLSPEVRFTYRMQELAIDDQEKSQQKISGSDTSLAMAPNIPLSTNMWNDLKSKPQI